MKKKTLLTIGGTIAAIIPLATVVSCSTSNNKKVKTTPSGLQVCAGNFNGGVNNTTPSGPQVGVGNVNGGVNNYSSTFLKTTENKSEYDRTRQKLINFTITDITENPHINGMLSDVDSRIRSFKLYDNGLFKIKIDHALIGQGRIYGTADLARKQAEIIALGINIGPAILNLPKGIQILHSNAPASLGGDAGVQVALGNYTNCSSTTTENLYSIASLVEHEYGHHETLWDYHHYFGQNGMAAAEKLILNANGLSKVASLIGDTHAQLNFITVDKSNWPSGYSQSPATGPQVFGQKGYPFGSAEIATRVLNIMSGTAKGMPNPFFIKTNAMNPSAGTFPAMLTSYSTMKYHAKDAIFGVTGKDNSHIKGIFDGWLSKILGNGKKSIGIKIDVNNGFKLSNISLDSFGSKIEKIIIKDPSGKLVKEVKGESFNGLFGYKDELLAKTQAHKIVVPISNISANVSIPNAKDYSIYAYDNKNAEIDLSKFKLNNAKAPGNTNSFWGSPYIKVVAKHIVISR